MVIDILGFLLMVVIAFPLANLMKVLGHVFFIKLVKWELTSAGIGKGPKIFQIGKIRIHKKFFKGYYYRSRSKSKLSNPWHGLWVALAGTILNSVIVLVIYIIMKVCIIKYNFITAGILSMLMLRIALDLMPYKYKGYYSVGIKIYEFIRNGSIGDYADSGTMLREHDSIIRYYEKRGVKASGLAEAYYNKGVVQYKLKRFKEAIECFDKAIELKPDYSSAHNSKGNSLLGLGKYEEAIDCYTMAVVLISDNQISFYNIACAYSLLNNADEAVLYLKKAVEMNKRSKVLARKEKDFDNIRENAKFKEVVFS